ncbi:MULTISPECIES: hypothetical protein [Nocardia]|uniref:hypothetical protein n=1 Tax=Nocardia TaxID=1817 RepID=UPI0024548517|nr:MULTISPECIES: hypothetical protein [Nocardia]
MAGYAKVVAELIAQGWKVEINVQGGPRLVKHFPGCYATIFLGSDGKFHWDMWTIPDGICRIGGESSHSEEAAEEAEKACINAGQRPAPDVAPRAQLSKLEACEKMHMLGEWHANEKCRTTRPRFTHQREYFAYECGWIFGQITGEYYKLAIWPR